MGDRLLLGTSGLKVSPYCLGRAPVSEVHAAHDHGINFFFVTVDMHWPLYRELRDGLRELIRRDDVHRDDLVIAAVTYVAQPEFTWLPMQELLDEVPELERLDVLIMGGVYAHDHERRLESLQLRRAERRSGISAIGATFHDRVAARESYNQSALDIAYIRYNAAHIGAETEVFPYLQPDRSSTLLFGFNSLVGHVGPERLERLALDDDYWIPEPEDHYRFVLSQPGIDGVLFACNAPGQMTARAEILAQGPLSEAEREHMIGLRELRPLK